MGNFLLQNLQIVRKAKYKTQDECATKLGYKRSTYASYESGNTKADVDFLMDFSNHFGISIDDLIFNNLQLDGNKVGKRKVQATQSSDTDRVNELFKVIANLNSIIDIKTAEVEALKKIRQPSKATAGN